MNQYRRSEFIEKFGRNQDVDSSANETVWAAGGLYTFASGAEDLEILSDDANDTAAGTGARTVRIVGLDANYNEFIDTYTLNGTTAVAMNQRQYLRVHRCVVVSAGTGFGDFHRATPAWKKGWRFFIRASFGTKRLVTNETRLQSQVYLRDLTAGW